MHYLLVMIVFLSSCSMYKRKFDCPPCQGVSCISVSTLESMIVESQCGSDEFLGCVPKLVDVKKDPICKCSENCGEQIPFQRRVWISPKCEQRPFYIYFKEDYVCDEQ